MKKIASFLMMTFPLNVLACARSEQEEEFLNIMWVISTSVFYIAGVLIILTSIMSYTLKYKDNKQIKRYRFFFVVLFVLNLMVVGYIYFQDHLLCSSVSF